MNTQNPNAAGTQRVVLLKAKQIAHQAGFYLQNGRWHKVSEAKPAPKGHPVLAEKPASGHTRITSEMWQQLHDQHPENSNKATYSKKLEKLKEAYHAGDTHAILGASYPNDTTHKKVAHVANFVLGAMGSDHQVHAGLKQGTHPALSAAAASQPAAEAKPQPTPAPAPKAAPKAPEKAPEPAPKAEPKPEPKQAQPAMGALSEAHWQAIKDSHPDNSNKKAFVSKVEKIQEAYNAGDAHAILAMSFPNDTTGKKVVHVANAALKDLGNEHTVHAGLKQGTHHALGQKAEEKPKEPAAVTPAEPAAKGDFAVGEKLKFSTALAKVNKGTWEIYNQNDDTYYLKKVGAKVPNSTNTVTVPKATLSQALAAGTVAKLDEAGAPTSELKTSDNYLPAAKEEGPKDGDTKKGADGTLVFKDGHWHKQEEPVKVTETDVTPKGHGIDGPETPEIDPASYAGQYGVLMQLEQAGDVQGMKDFAAKHQNDPKLKGLAQLANEKLAKLAPTEEKPKEPAPVSGLAMPSFEEGAKTTGVVAHYEKVAQKIMDLASQGEAEQLKLMVSDKGKTWKGTTANSKKLLALHAEAIKLASGEKPAEPPKSNLTPNLKKMLDELVAEEDLPGIEGTIQSKPEGSDAHAYAVRAKQKLEAKLEKKKAAAPAMTADGTPIMPTFSLDSFAAAATGLKAMADSGKIIGLKMKLAEYADLAKTTPAVGEHPDHLKLMQYGEALVAQAVKAKASEAPAQQAPAPASAKPMPAVPAFNEFNYTLVGKAWKMLAEQGKFKDLSDTVMAAAESAKTSDALKNDPEYKKLLQYGVDLMSIGNDQAKAKLEASKAKDQLFKYVNMAGSQSAAKSAAQSYLDTFGHTPENIKTAFTALKEHGYDKAATEILTKEEEEGPSEGDTKQGVGGMLVFKNGHWVLMDQGQPAADDVHPIDAVPLPDLSNFTKSNQDKVKKGIELLKEKIKAEGPSALKGATLNMKSKGKYITTLPTMSGYTPLKIHGWHGADNSHEHIYHYVEALKEAAGKAPKSSKKKAAPAPAMPSINLNAAAPDSMDSWEKVGEQKGSNPGGVYLDDQGHKWYCKFPQTADIAKTEVLAAKLYAEAGAAAQDCKLVTMGGKLAIATKWVDGLQTMNAHEMTQTEGVAEFFAVDAWLANHDVIGMDYTNIQKGPDGKAIRVDAGGSLEYKAQGDKKEFGDSVDSLDSMMNPKYHQPYSVFGHLTKEDITASVAKVVAIPDEAIVQAVMQFGPGDNAHKVKLAQTLIARKADLLAKYPNAAPKKLEKPPVYRIPNTPDFHNWNGPGQSLSSKKAFNDQNQALAQQIHDLGVAGDVKKLEEMTFQPINEQGVPTGDTQHITQHKSKHIPAYWNDVVKAMKTPYVSPKVAYRQAVKNVSAMFLLTKAAFQSCKELTTAKVKVGRYALLGVLKGKDNPLKDWNPATLSQKQGNLSPQTLYDLSKKSFNALPALEKQAIKDYTGSDYTEMNNALVFGKHNDKTQNAIKGLDKACVMLTPGTVLSRYCGFNKGDDGSISQKNHHEALQRLIDAGEGAIIEEFGIISTSTNSTTWSGPVHLKITVGEGVKGLYVAPNPSTGGAAISENPSENEVILPFKTKFMIKKIHPPGTKFQDENGYWGANCGDNPQVIEVIALPNI